MTQAQVVTTTLKLPEHLHHAAKVLAVTNKMKLNDFFIAAIEKAVPATKKSK